MARVRATEHGTSARRQNRAALSVVGLGRLGIGLATTLACCGFDVVGVDTDERVVQLVNLAHAPFAEAVVQRTGRGEAREPKEGVSLFLRPGSFVPSPAR